MNIARRLVLGGAVSLAFRRPANAAPAPWTALWEDILRRHVNALGQVDFDAIQRDPAPLRQVTEAIGESAPNNRPELYRTTADRVAFWLNAYNALAMWGVIQWNVPTRFDLLDRWRFFIDTDRRIGGQSISLNDLETDIIRPIGDERVHFGLNCMVRDCPRLPREAFLPDRLEAQLAAAATLFCTDDRTIRPDPAHRSVWLSAIFEFYTKDFVPAKAPNLIAYVNRWRTEKLPEDAKVRFLPYDWTINRQPPPAG